MLGAIRFEKELSDKLEARIKFLEDWIAEVPDGTDTSNALAKIEQLKEVMDDLKAVLTSLKALIQ